jgi:hypothetical protein
MSVVLAGRRNSVNDWSWGSIEQFYEWCASHDEEGACRIRMTLHTPSDSLTLTTAEKIVSRGEGADSTLLLFDLTALFTTALVTRLTMLYNLEDITIDVPHDCEYPQPGMSEYGLAVDADEESGEQDNWPWLTLHCRLTDKVDSDVRGWRDRLKMTAFDFFHNGNRTVLSVTLDTRQSVRVRLYDLAGNLAATLCNGPLSPGRHRFVPGSCLPKSGVFIGEAVSGTEQKDFIVDFVNR